ncbi:hypothetical protein ACB092_05G104100 [Castanea dentata]
MIGFHSLLLSLFIFKFLPQLSKTHLSFLPLYSVFSKLIRTPFEILYLFLLSFLVSLCVQEQVEETYIMVKPDVVQRGLVGEIISGFEKKGFKLTGLKLFECPKELAEDVHAVQQSPTLQKSSAASHQPSCL